MIPILRRDIPTSDAMLVAKRTALLPWRMLLPVLALSMVVFFWAAKAGAAWPLAEWPSKKEAVMPANPAHALSEAENFQRAVSRLAARLGENLEASNAVAGLLEDGLVVCSFVELKKLNRTSSFGRYMADQLINELQQHQYRVVELRKTKDIFVQAGRGEFGLSRESAKISSEASAGAMLTGTYTLTPEEVMINARIVDNRDNAVLASASTAMPRTQLVSNLLADSATAKAKTEREFIYMKQLMP